MATFGLQPSQQLRNALATMDLNQFASLRATLETARSAVELRLSQLDTEREVLVARRARLDAALAQLGQPKAFEQVRTAMLRLPGSVGAGLTVKPIKPPKKAPAKPRIQPP